VSPTHIAGRAAAVPPAPLADSGRAAVRQGFLDALTLVPSTLLLGLIFGASAQAAGVGRGVAVAMSAIVFSGSGQSRRCRCGTRARRCCSSACWSWRCASR
jgi:hypothetical protein